MDTDPAGAFDYLWVRGLKAKECTIFGQEKISEGVYPSDHMGVLSVY
jgi:hypothetical protein